MSKEPHDTSDILHTDQSTWSGMIFNLPISDKCVEMVTPTCSNKDGLYDYSDRWQRNHKKSASSGMIFDAVMSLANTSVLKQKVDG